jgi:hypothetical protein
MSVSGIASPNLDLSQLLQSGGSRQSAPTSVSGANEGAGKADFMASLMSRIAAFQSEALEMLMAANGDTDSDRSSSNFALFDAAQDSANPLGSLLGGTSTVDGLFAFGRNTALADPESAYRMMTLINGKDVDFKAEFAEMGDMKSQLAALRREALGLGDIDSATANADIRARLLAFADAYNGWIRRFDEGLQSGGLLAGTQAAQVAQWELEQSVENIFNGAKDGLHGMRDLGFTIDPVTNLASLDSGRLDAALASNKTGVIGAVRELSANFAKSAELLTADGNIIPNRMDNLARAIDFLDDNMRSLQAEFGLGAAARPSGQVARALASYNAVYAMAG